MAAQPDQAAPVTGGQQGDQLPGPAGAAASLSLLTDALVAERQRASQPFAGVPDFGPRFRPGDQSPPVPNSNPSVHDLVIADLPSWALGSDAERAAAAALLLKRKQLGLDRYKSLLQAGNGRSWHQDSAEELADFCCYVKQGIEEGAPGLETVYERGLALLCEVLGLEGGEPS